MRYFTGIGSRQTPPEVMAQMSWIAAKLTTEKDFILRSGGADGADTAFEQGAAADKREVWLPWDGFNGRVRDGKSYLVPMDDCKNVNVQMAWAIAERVHPNWAACTQGARRLHTRNVYQVLGRDLNTMSEFVVAWAPVIKGKPIGGTATALKLAGELGIPCFNLYVPGEFELFKSMYLLEDEMTEEKPIKLDVFHWHEALHTAHVINCMCQDHLMDHHTFKHLPVEAQQKLEQAIVLINDYYQACAQKQDDLESGK